MLIKRYGKWCFTYKVKWVNEHIFLKYSNYCNYLLCYMKNIITHDCKCLYTHGTFVLLMRLHMKKMSIEPSHHIKWFLILWVLRILKVICNRE